MPDRTEQSSVRFASPFWLSGLSEQQPAGEYRVEHVWERFEGLTQMGYRRTASFLHLPAVGAASLTHQAVPIDPAELEAALEKDRAP